MDQHTALEPLIVGTIDGHQTTGAELLLDTVATSSTGPRVKLALRVSYVPLSFKF